jgi:hypothetical protein
MSGVKLLINDREKTAFTYEFHWIGLRILKGTSAENQGGFSPATFRAILYSRYQ